MKALSIRVPWWLAVLEWGKDVENRFWQAPIAFRGEVLLHASAHWDDLEVQEDVAAAKRAREAMKARGIAVPPAPARTWEYLKAHRGGIVGRARIVDARWNRDSGNPWAVDASPELPPRFRETGALGLVLADAEPLSFVPLKGALGLFEVTPDSVRGDPRRAKDGPEHVLAAESLIKLLNGGMP